MMPSVVREKAAGREVLVAQLYEFQFLSQTCRFWNGLGFLDTLDERRWQGAGKVISVSGLQYPTAQASASATFTLSGSTPELLGAAINSDTEVTGRPCAVYLQFLTGRYKPLDAPVAVWSGNMDVLSFSGDVKNQSLSLSAETLFVDRVRSPYSYQTDRDQQARYPGDRGYEFMPQLRNKTVPWLRS